MGTNYIAPIWRMPRNANKDKLSNYSVEFNGSSQAINCGNGSDVDITGPISISVWFNATTVGNARGIVCKNDAAAQQTFAQYFFDLLSGEIRWRAGASTVTHAISADQWYHAVGVYDGSNTTLYIDGTEVATAAAASSSYQSNQPMYIGRRLNQAYFGGKIAQVCIFDYALTDGTGGTTNQIEYLYNLNNPMVITGGEPVAYWPLGDNSNPNADAGYPNISVGADSVFDFNGSGDYIDAGNPTSLQITGALTISAWVKFTGNIAPIVSKYESGSSARPKSFGLDGDRSGSNHSPQFFIYNSGTAYSTPTSVKTVDDGNWHHLVGVFNPSTSLQLYIDGVLEQENTTSIPATIDNDAADFVIGAIKSLGSPVTFFTGEMSNIQVWNTNLLSSDVDTLYNNGQPLMTGTQPEAANLKAWYKLDQSANWEADTVGEWQIPDAVSAYPQSFDFDGSSEIINLGNDASLYPQTGDMSYSFWVNPDVLSGYQTVYGITPFSTTSKGVNINLFGSEVRVFMGVGVNGQWGVNTGGGTGGASLTTSSSGLTVGQWTHVAVTLDRDGNGVIYIDGVPNVTAAMNPNDYSAVDIVASSDMLIGNGNGYLNGKTSNLQVWNSNLSASQVLQLYNNGTPLTTAIASDNLKAWYKLDKSKDLFSGNLPDVMFLSNDYKQNFTKALKIADTAGKSINLASSLDLGTEHTISYWLISPASWGTRAGSIATDGSQNRIYISNSTAYYRASGGTQVYDSNMGWGWYGQAGVWYNFVITRKDGNVNFYNNGSITGSSPHSFTASETLSLKDFLGHSSQWGETIISNVVILDKELTSSEVTTMYNNGNPIYNLSDIPQSSNVKLWWKLNTDPSSNIVDSSGNNQTGVTSNYVSSDLKNIAVGTNSGKTSGMTEQNLVNNNVSALNGESSGMDTTNLVQSNLTKKQPFSSYSIQFDGTGYIDAGAATSLTQTPQLSVSFWVNQNDTTAFDYYLSIGDNNGTPTEFLELYSHPTASRSFNVEGSIATAGFQSFDYTSYVSNNTWFHVALVWDSTESVATDRIKIYIDGALRATLSGVTSTFNTNGEIKIGRTWRNTSNTIDGKLSNISIFDQVLNQDDVLNIYNNGVTQDLSNFRITPVAWYPMDQSYTYFNGSVLVARDVINGNDGTGQNIIQANIVGNAPGSTGNGTGTNLTIADLKGNMKSSDKNAYSINMADYASGVANPASSGRSTEIPTV